MTQRGHDFQSARLSVDLGNRYVELIRSTPMQFLDTIQIAIPNLLLVNCGLLSQDRFWKRELSDLGPTLAFTEPAKQTALKVWAQDPRVAADWKALQTLREKFPKDRSGEYSAPDYLALKAWRPVVRAAHRRAERHRLLICLEVDPAYWDNLPIETLDRLTKEHTAWKRRFAALTRARIRREERAKRSQPT